MALEIERKFLLSDDSWRQSVRHQEYYQQGYLSGTERCSIRVRVTDDRAFLNIKSATLGIQRTEYDYPIPLDDARQMLEQFCQGAIIEKTRYFIHYGRHVWEIDVFEGDNRGLVVAEIELADANEPFDRPPWVGEEVSDDPRYYNVCLVNHPYSQWAE